MTISTATDLRIGCSMTALTMLVVALGGCTSSGPQPTQATTSRADLRSLEDRGPYWCKLIPQGALIRMTGNRRWTAGPDDLDIQPVGGGICFVSAPAPEQRMTLEVEAGRAVHLVLNAVRLPANVKKFRDFPGRLTLGAGVGRVRPGSPDGSYIAYALFSCDRRNIAFELNVGIGRGRGVVRDVSAMMTIAERRYAALAGCGLGPADRKLVPPDL
jgi:hypothetical protein